MPTPLDSFIATLHKRDTDTPVPPDYSLPTHTHTSEGFSYGDAGMECETKCEAPLTLPVAPLQPGWIVTYTNSRGKLCGGWDEQRTITVVKCHGAGQDCQVELSDGRQIPLRAVRAIGQTNAEGRLIAAWTVREHGYDGHGEISGMQPKRECL